MFNNMFFTNNVLASAMQATQLRNNIISHNIANVNVPAFNRSVVEFENHLRNEIDRAARRGERINLNNVNPQIVVQTEPIALRTDGNNVDIEAEMIALTQNATRYEVMSISVMNNYRRINSVLNSNI